MAKSKNYVDMSDIFKELNRLGKNVDKSINKAVDNATPIAKKALSKNAPVSHEKKKHVEHLKDHVIVSKSKQGQADVGFDDEVAWRVHFVEFGTIYQRPNAFIQKTMKEVEEEVANVIQATLQRELFK